MKRRGIVSALAALLLTASLTNTALATTEGSVASASASTTATLSSISDAQKKAISDLCKKYDWSVSDLTFRAVDVQSVLSDADKVFRYSAFSKRLGLSGKDPVQLFVASKKMETSKKAYTVTFIVGFGEQDETKVSGALMIPTLGETPPTTYDFEKISAIDVKPYIIRDEMAAMATK